MKTFNTLDQAQKWMIDEEFVATLADSLGGFDGCRGGAIRSLVEDA